MIKPVDLSNFDQAVSKGVVVVEFYASWCSPCKILLPILQELSIEYDDIVSFYNVDVDEHEELATKFNIKGVPTILIFKKGEMEQSITGMVLKSVLIEKLKRWL
jgi:thioredoxin 1